MLPEKASRIIGGYTVNRPVYRDGNRFAVALPHAECSLQINPAVQAVFLAQMLKGGNHIMCAVEMTGGTDADSDFYHFIIPTAFPKGKAPFPVHSGDRPDKERFSPHKRLCRFFIFVRFRTLPHPAVFPASGNRRFQKLSALRRRRTGREQNRVRQALALQLLVLLPSKNWYRKAFWSARATRNPRCCCPPTKVKPLSP